MSGIDHTKNLNDFGAVEHIKYMIPRHDLMNNFVNLTLANEVWESCITDLVDNFM